MKVMLHRDRTRTEGEYGAWDGHLWDGDTFIGSVTGETRDAALDQARALEARYTSTEPIDEWVEL